MKFIYIVFSGLGQLFRKNKLVFALFIIGSISASLMFSYFYGNMIGYLQYETKDDFAHRLFCIYGVDSDLFPEIIEELSKDDRIEDIRFSSNFSEYDRINVVASFHGEISDPETLVGRTFTDDEISSSEMVAICTVYSSGKGPDIGDSITINGYEFECIGKHSKLGVYIPYTTYMALGFGNDSSSEIQIVLKDADVARSKEFYEEMSVFFGDARAIDSPYLSMQYEKSFAKSELLIYVCPFYAVSMLAFMFLLKYLIDETADEMVVYSVCGASKTTVSVMLFWEIAILSLTTGVVGALLHKLLYRSVFDKLNVVPGIRYRFVDYAVICLSMLVISMLVSLPFIASFRKLSLIDSKRKCDV